MARLREDARFRAVQPESFDQDASMQPLDPAAEDELDDTLELWFDWAFVDFWKNHYCELPFLRPSTIGVKLTCRRYYTAIYSH